MYQYMKVKTAEGNKRLNIDLNFAKQFNVDNSFEQSELSEAD